MYKNKQNLNNIDKKRRYKGKDGGNLLDSYKNQRIKGRNIIIKSIRKDTEIHINTHIKS